MTHKCGGEFVSQESLTSLEAALVRAVAQGQSGAHVAQKAGLSESQLNSMLQEVYRKLGVSSRIELILFAHSQAARSAPAATGPQLWSVEQADGGTAKKASFSDATAGEIDAAGEWAA